MPLTKKEEERILKSHGFQWFLDLKKELAKKGKPGDENAKILQD